MDRALRSGLNLIPGNESQTGGSWSADDYDVVLVDTAETFGRIYARTSAGMAVRIGGGASALPYYGLSESKEAANQAFAEGWRG